MKANKLIGLLIEDSIQVKDSIIIVKNDKYYSQLPHHISLKFLVRTGVDGLRTLVLNFWLKGIANC